MTSKKLEIVAEPGKTSFTTSRVVDAPRELVFEAFTKCEHFKRWMGPRNLTMVSCETDLRPGGRYELGRGGAFNEEAGVTGICPEMPSQRSDVAAGQSAGAEQPVRDGL